MTQKLETNSLPTQNDAEVMFGFQRKMMLNFSMCGNMKGYGTIHGYHTYTNFNTNG